jgi:hypothetical protein
MRRTSLLISTTPLLLAALVFAIAPATPAYANATITIVNKNAPGIGFNDPTVVAPVGGNAGTTLGQQRLIAFQAAADIWAATLDSNVPIQIIATFEPLTCTATSATLGSAGTIFICNFGRALFPGAEFPHWYTGAGQQAVRNQLNTTPPAARTRPAAPPTPTAGPASLHYADLRARFNST